MGCHTWFYKKIETPSEDEIRSTVKDRCEREIQFLEKLIHRRSEIDEDLLEAYPEWTPDYAKEIKPHWERIIAFANGGSIDLSEFPEYFFEEDYDKENLLSQFYAAWQPKLTVYIPERGFYEEVEFHDVFRKYGYPEDLLFSLEETLTYINNPKNKCSIHDKEWTLKTLYEFWKKYPDGMIQFG
jgi:hypothetical protein